MNIDRWLTALGAFFTAIAAISAVASVYVAREQMREASQLRELSERRDAFRSIVERYKDVCSSVVPEEIDKIYYYNFETGAVSASNSFDVDDAQRIRILKEGHVILVQKRRELMLHIQEAIFTFPPSFGENIVKSLEAFAYNLGEDRGKQTIDTIVSDSFRGREICYDSLDAVMRQLSDE
jgi:hypothetical protein